MVQKLYRCVDKSVLLFVLFLGCAGKTPLPQHLRVAGIEELRVRLNAARPSTQSYFADADLTYFGPKGRLRGRASVAVGRPNRFRFDVYGPHGGVVQAFATDGVRVQLLQVSQSRFIQDEATVANLARLLPIAPIAMDATGWVTIFFGEFITSSGAVLDYHYDDTQGHFVVAWDANGQHIIVAIDPQTSRVVRVGVYEKKKLVSEVRIEKRDSVGIPVNMHLYASSGTHQMHMRIKLRNITHDPTALNHDTFVLHPPRGVAIESLGE